MKKRTVLTVASILFLGSAIPARAQIVDLRADWHKGECLQKASPAASARFKITGPGRLEVHLYLDPYRHAGRAAFVPLSWTRYLASGKQARGWGVMGEAFEGQGYPDHFFQGGKEARSWAEGIPWEMVSIFDVAQGEYDIGVIIVTPAINYGCGFSQWQQKARLVINFAPKGSMSSQEKAAVSQSTASGAGSPGTWIHAPAGAWDKAHADAIMNYVTWDGGKWTAKIEGNQFVHAPGGDWSQAHADTIMNYVTWDGSKWTAKIDNGVFLHAPNGDWSRAHKDSIINYITWDGSKWTAKITYPK
jgi:hypothetical protein